jgi:sulfite exporter TauE/SafE
VDLFLPMLGVGLVTSVHCVAMCGSLVLTYAVKDAEDGPLRKRMMPHLVYQGAKIISYITVGLILGLIGAAFDLGGIRGFITVFAGAFMVLLGLNMTGWFPWLRQLTPRPPKFLMKALMSTRKKAQAEEREGKQSLATPATFGLLTGLMPCGPLQAAQLAAAGAGSALAGATTMLGFGLGTAPLMLVFGAVSGALTVKFRDRMMTVAALAIVILGGVMLDRGLMLVGSPVTFQSVKTAFVGSPTPETDASQYQVGADGYVEVPLAIINTRFVPEVINIPADQPVRLIVDRQEDGACSDQIAVPQMGILEDLVPNGVTAVELPASAAGNYTLTCGMGMMSGGIIAGSVAAAGAPNLVLPLLAVALAGLVVVLVLRRRGSTPAACAVPGAKVAPTATSQRILGLAPAEFVILIGVLSGAIIAGLTLGGLFAR